jgi:hypothetical protein
MALPAADWQWVVVGAGVTTVQVAFAGQGAPVRGSPSIIY